MNTFLCIVIGLVSGIASGLLGIGGGVIMIPALVYFFGLSQHQAQGTTLAVMVLPIGLLAAIKYYQAGNVNVGIAVFIALGFFVGGLIGALIAQPVADIWLKRIFGVFMLFIALDMIFRK